MNRLSTKLYRFPQRYPQKPITYQGYKNPKKAKLLWDKNAKKVNKKVKTEKYTKNADSNTPTYTDINTA